MRIKKFYEVHNIVEIKSQKKFKGVLYYVKQRKSEQPQ